MTSVVIAAYNEGRVIGRCLDALLAGSAGRLESSSPPTAVATTRVDRPAARASSSWTCPSRASRRLSTPRSARSAPFPASTSTPTCSSRPATWIVWRRRWTTVLRANGSARRGSAARGGHDRERVPRSPVPPRPRAPPGLPALTVRARRRRALRSGRARFDVFPAVLADDFFLDSLFGPDEKVVVPDVVSVVGAPSSTRVLLRRLARVRRGNRELRVSARRCGRPPGRGTRVAAESRPARPRLLPAAVTYVS